ncbi:putative Zn(II)2Cys6 transcription factor-like protein [Dendryphion nanum]|uniref:Zn(II)2Cys6 transcription factor-like protein n=1 Tax=Dendryphion nanum TaxID=256645 RepID=A0A9P9I9S0_9PLEO|nr:putative Zn(II)2Cys6 transcription factor-like protein [Dendryphion nanum]
MGEPRARQRKFAPRSRQGCLTCRARRKRCDQQRPECQNCTRLNVKCEWQTQRQIIVNQETPSSPTQSSSTSSDLVPSLHSPLQPWDSLPGNSDAERKHLLSYYIEAFVPSISVATTPSSFYTSLYIPMAFESEGILDAIIALSSAQLAKRTTDSDRANYLQALSAKHQVKCHSFLRHRISSPGKTSTDFYQVIGILLLLVGLECLLGSKHTKWLHQMRCARNLLKTLALHHNNIASWEVESLHRHFTYHDMMASVMPKTEPTRLDDGDIALPPSALLLGQTIDPLMGISYNLCSLICRIQYVTSPDPAFPHVSEAAFDAIERDIMQWQYESPLSSPCIDLPVGLDLIALAEAYRLAALIQLYRTSEKHKVLVPACAARALQFIARIPPGSPAESSMLYPVFLAGAELEDETQIASCFQRLSTVQERNYYENVGMVQEVLKEVWRPALNGEKKRDWEDVLKEWQWSFSLG